MAERGGKANPQLDASDLLVVGFQGTLRPSEPSSPAQPLSPIPPPAIEELLAPWLADAARELDRRTPAPWLVFRGEPIPLDGLLQILKNRLLSLLLQAMEVVTPLQLESIRYAQLPVLRHLLQTTLAEWIAASILFLERFSRDQARLAATHHLDQMPPIRSISGCTSDAHAGGHFVLRIAFTGGPSLYYKPRAVTGEWLWHSLLEAIAQREPDLRLPAAHMLPGGQSFRYGWMRSLAASDQIGGALAMHAQNPAGKVSADYWHHAGAMLCLAQHVRLTDLHLANILATPHGPAIVDAECLGTPGSSSRQSNPFRDALDSLQETGLLPISSAPGKPDVSGLFGHAGPIEGIRIPQWTVASDGQSRLVPSSAALVDHHNAPSRITPAAVLPQLLAGYRHAAQMLLSTRASLLRPDSPWRLVLEKQHATRIVLRDTLTYAQWISRSLALRYLRSHPARQAAVAATVNAADGPRHSRALFRTETRAILRAQVPRLVLLPGTRTAASSAGRPIAHRFTCQTSAQAVMETIERLSHRHLEDALVPALFAACLKL